MIFILHSGLHFLEQVLWQYILFLHSDNWSWRWRKRRRNWKYEAGRHIKTKPYWIEKYCHRWRKKIEKQDDKNDDKQGEENKKDTTKGKEKLIEDDDVDSKEIVEEIDTNSSEEHEAQEPETEGNKRKIKEK